MVQGEDGIECEIIDLRTLLPWDRDTIGEPQVLSLGGFA